MRGVTRKWVRIGLAIAAGATVLSGVLLWQAYRTARSHLSESRCDGNTAFVRSQWMDTTLALGRRAIRGCMVDDLLFRHELRGMTQREVIALIGEPAAAELDSDLFPEASMVYWLGPERGLIGTDSEFLVIRLDSAKRVVAVEVRTG